MSSLARSIVEYAALQCRDNNSMQEGARLGESSNKVEQMLSASHDCMAAYNSLMALRQYFYKEMMEEAMHNGGDRGKVVVMADSCHKVVALLGISHFSLKGEFDFGEASFRTGLRGKLREVEQFLPFGVGVDTLVELCVRYFRVRF